MLLTALYLRKRKFWTMEEMQKTKSWREATSAVLFEVLDQFFDPPLLPFSTTYHLATVWANHWCRKHVWIVNLEISYNIQQDRAKVKKEKTWEKYICIQVLIPPYSVSAFLLRTPIFFFLSFFLFFFFFITSSLWTSKYDCVGYSYFLLIAKPYRSRFSRLDPSSIDSGKR